MEIIPRIQTQNKIEIYEVVNWNDTKKFSWYIDELRPIRWNFSLQDVTCRSEKSLFYDRKSLISWNYNNKTIEEIIELLINPYNALWEQRTIQWDFIWTTSVEIRKWDVFYDILDDVCKEFNVFWKIESWVIYFSQNLWIDRSIWWQYYQEVYYNDKQPSDTNIVDVNLVWTATRSNIAIAKNYNWSITIDTSRVVDWVVYWVVYEEFKNNDSQTTSFQWKIDKLLDASDRRKFSYNFFVQPNSLDADVWDTVKIIIENTNSNYDINWSTIILKKNILYTHGHKIENFTVWDIYSTPFEFQDWVWLVEKKIRQVQIRS
jgi:hypothetical protein